MTILDKRFTMILFIVIIILRVLSLMLTPYTLTQIVLIFNVTNKRLTVKPLRSIRVMLNKYTEVNLCDRLHQKVPYWPCYKLLVSYINSFPS